MSSGTTLEIKEIQRIYRGFAIEAQKQITSHLPRSKKRVIIISGPTGTGKSEFAFRLAQEMGGEIVSADSMQVYRGMDIGTAKPTVEERLQIPHHLVDIRDVTDSFNVVDFYYEARQSFQTILARENVPIVVGGSGFYIHALLYGPPSGPPSVPELRQAIENEASQIGLEALFERLQMLDPDYARTITKRDKQKIIRALEIITLTGKNVSKLSWKARRKPLHYDFRCWFLHRPREKLYERINQRCDRMIADGLIDEVKALDKLGIRSNNSAAQAIGYRQALEFLDSAQTEADYDQFIEQFKQASRHYAKRQITWFNSEHLFRWIDMDAHDPEVISDMIRQDYDILL